MKVKNGDVMGVSIVIPVFLRESSKDAIHLFDRALSSIFEQSYRPPLEVIVVDDGSAQPILSFIDNMRYGKCPEIRWLRLERNNGIVYALNRGILAAKYDLVARLDADDCWSSDKFAKQLNFFEKDDDLTIVATGMTIVDEIGQEIERHVRANGWNEILRFFSEVGCPFPHGSVIAKREIYRILGGYSHRPDVRHCEDYDLWGRWIRFFKPAMVEEALYIYTSSRTSVSAEHQAQQAAASGRVQQSFRDLNITETIPLNMREFASSLGVSMPQAGIVAFRMWSNPLHVQLPYRAVGPLRALLTDRDVRSSQTLPPSSLPFKKLLSKKSTMTLNNEDRLLSVTARAIDL